MRKHFSILALVMILCLAFILPANAIKIAPYSQPLHDIMHWDVTSAKLIIQNPENENLTVSWPATVDLWNYNGNVWTYDLPDGDKFAFSKRVDFNISTTEGAGSTVRSISLTDTVGAANGIHEGIRSHVTSAFMTGSWCNAVVGVITYSAAGSAGGGMAAPICSEMNMQPAASSGGSYYSVHSYFNVPTSAELIDSTAFNYAFEAYELAGGAKGEFDDYGDFWHIVGLTPLVDHILSANYLTLRILVQPAATAYDKFLVLSHAQNMLSMGTAIAPVPIVATDPKIGVYTSVAAIATGAVNSVVISQVTGGDVTGTAYQGALDVTLNAQHQSGNWANAIMSRIIYDPDGDARGGMAAVVCAEMYLPDKATPGGSYYNYESNMVAPTNWVGSALAQVVAFEHYVVGGAGVADLDDKGNMLHLEGCSTTASGLFYLADLTVTKADGLLKINVNGTEYYMFITTAINGGD